MKYLIKFTTIPKNKYDHPVNRETTIDCENALIAKIVFEKNFGAVGKEYDFKVGDKVEIIGNCNSHDFKIGEVVELINFLCYYLYVNGKCFKCTNGKSEWNICEIDMKLVERKGEKVGLMRELKAGDKVRVKTLEQIEKEYKVTFEGFYKCGGNTLVERMKKLCGNEVTISRYEGKDYIKIEEDCHVWTLEMFDLSEETTQEIHITRKGNSTIGVMKENGEVIKRVEAKLNPNDDIEYDFSKGSEIVMDRLFGRETKNIVEEKVKFSKKSKKDIKVGDRIVIVKDNGCHVPDLKIGDIQTVLRINKVYFATKENAFEFGKPSQMEEFEILESDKTLADYTNEELLNELKLRLN